MASSKGPCLVRTQRARIAPATRNREVSLLPERSRSSLMASVCSSTAHPQLFPLTEQIPCPNWVIFTAVHCWAGKAEIIPATTLVLPTLRECPPTTMVAITNSSWPCPPAPPALSNIAEAGAPECPRRPRLCRESLFSRVRRTAHPGWPLLPRAHDHQCRPGGCRRC